MNFLIDRLLPFWGETSSFLFDGFEEGVDVQPVCDHCGVNSPHILLLLGEYFYVLFQEVDKEVLDVFGKFGSCNIPKYTLVVFDMFRVFCKHNLNVS